MVPPRGTLTHRDEPRSTRSAGSHAQVAGQLVPQPGPTVDPPGNWQSSGFSVNMQSCIPGHGSIQSEETQASPFLSRWQEVRGAMTCSLPQRDSHSMPRATGSVTMAHRAGPSIPAGKSSSPGTHRARWLPLPVYQAHGEAVASVTDQHHVRGDETNVFGSECDPRCV